MVRFAPHLPWRDADVAARLGERLPIPVSLEHDANSAAWGEYRFGAARGARDWVLFALGTGIGGGIILDGKLFAGANEAGAEIGHMVVETTDGWRCGCGRRGCWEAYGSATGLKHITRDEMEQDRTSAMWDMVEGDLDHVSGRTAFQAAEAGDSAGRRAVERYLRYLAVGIANLINIFQPEVICLGGGVSNEKDENFILPLTELVEQERFTHEGHQTRIVKCRLGNDAGIIGAALLG